MNGKELLAGMSYVNSKYIEEAEGESFRDKGRAGLRKPLLVAAIAALMLLLVGCAVVYVWRMRNIKVGEQTQTQPVIAENGIDILGYEEINQQVLTLAGLKGSPGYQAAMEWFRFRQEYDPDHALHMQMIEEGTVPEFPDEYYYYVLYSQEMKDKLDEILDKYNLKPMGAGLDFRTVKNRLEALGIERLLTTGNGVLLQSDSGGALENGNFWLNMNIVLPEQEGVEVTNTRGILRWNRKDCFSDDLFAIEDTGDWKEWNYTTTSGNEVLIIRSDSDWRGWILCEREEAIMSLQIEARVDLGYNDGQRSWWDHLYMTDKQLEMVADAVDFGIQPNLISQEDVTNQPEASKDATQNGYTVKLKQVQTDGQVAYITLGITAPEGKIISRTTREGHEGDPFHIDNANFDRLMPLDGEVISGSFPMNPQEDGDGLDNTQDFVIEAEATMDDGSLPFGPGKVWKLRLEDLIHSYYDSDKHASVEEVLAEGEWEFEITFSEENGDYRELELIREPVMINAAGGFYPNGRDADQIVEVNSFILRKFSYSVGYEEEVEYVQFSDKNGMFLTVVMQDGTEIEATGVILDSPVDLSKVDHVRMVDGTKLYAPNSGESIEFLAGPTAMKFIGGYVEDAGGSRENLYETLELTSFRLYDHGAVAESEAGLGTPDVEILVHQKDGRSIPLTGTRNETGENDLCKCFFVSGEAIDLTQVDYLVFPDGSKLTVPETAE